MNNLSTFQRGNFVLSPIGLGMRLLVPRREQHPWLDEGALQPHVLARDAESLNVASSTAPPVPQRLPNTVRQGAYIAGWAEVD